MLGFLCMAYPAEILLAASSFPPEPSTASVPVTLAIPRVSESSPVLKVKFRQEGIYGVRLQDIADGMGIPLDDVRQTAAIGGLELRAPEGSIATHLDPAGDRILFHGRPTDNWYARDNAVLIRRGEGRTMPCRSPAAGQGESVFPVAARFEVDRYPFDAAPDRSGDFFYWEYVIAGNATYGTRDFPMDLSGYAGGDLALSVGLGGWTSTTNPVDHCAEVRVNGYLAGTFTLDGKQVLEASCTVPAGCLSNGLNTVSVKGVLPPGVKSSSFVVDGFEAFFLRSLAPVAGTLHFEPGGAPGVSAAAFAEPAVMALDEAGEPTWIADVSGGLPDKAWAVSGTDARYAVAEAATIPMLAPEPAAADPWFLAATNRIDYLVVASRELASAAQELADYRSSQGLRAGVAVFEDICDEMAGGIRTPEAVPALLSRAAANWAEAPWMLVLAGNGHYDYLGAMSNEVNHLPPLLVETSDGLYAADGLAGDVDGDGLPDVAVGRLPARTPAELAAMVAKIKDYEAGFGADWQKEVLLAADKFDFSAGDFSAVNTRLSGLATGSFHVAARVDLDVDPIATARTTFLGRIKAGAGFVHYSGHGTSLRFSSLGLLTTNDVRTMTNRCPPVVVAYSCLAGRFEVPGPACLCLGEHLLQRAGGGAVAAWMSSGLPRLSPAEDLGAAFYRAVLQEGAGTLGLAILRARRSMEETLFARDTFATYNLLGDPALRLAGNTAGHASDETFAQWRWQRTAPAELAVPETREATEAKFFEYATAGAPLEAELPEFGYALKAVAEEQGFILRWKRRVMRSDVDYRLLLSGDLQTWQEDSPDLAEIGVETDPDGIMETVRTKVKRPDSMRVFVGIKAKRK